MDWKPEDYGFVKRSIDTVFENINIYNKNGYELRLLDNGYWLCRRLSIDKVTKQPIWLVRFYIKIENKIIAEYLLTKGIE